MNENNMKTPAQPNAKPDPDSLSQQAASALQQSMQGFAAELAQQQQHWLSQMQQQVEARWQQRLIAHEQAYQKLYKDWQQSRQQLDFSVPAPGADPRIQAGLEKHNQQLLQKLQQTEAELAAVQQQLVQLGESRTAQQNQSENQQTQLAEQAEQLQLALQRQLAAEQALQQTQHALQQAEQDRQQQLAALQQHVQDQQQKAQFKHQFNQQLQQENQQLTETQQALQQQLATLQQTETALREQSERNELLLQQARLRLDIALEKQQQESDQARETIRVLRMELGQLTEQYQQQISDLEQRVTEFKLKFEYAQRQLSATS